jgi:thiamine-monophosphate kinase
MELAFIDWLRGRLPSHPRLLLGPGDDAAVLRLAEGAGCVVTTDMLMDGVDFHLAQCDVQRVGRKALAVNLSDLAAMAARPVAAVISLALPRVGAKELAEALYEGLIPLAEEYDTAIAGGDTNCWDGPLVVSVTAIGESPRQGVWTRGGAKAGDWIVVTGAFGGSILGKHFDFTPRVCEAATLSAQYRVNAAIDVSDGLSLDLWRITEESHCGAVIDCGAIPISPAAVELAREGNDSRTPLDHALSDGEDFELILALAPEEGERLLADQPLGVPLTRIGEFIREPGLWRRLANGKKEPLRPQGFEH